MNSVNNDNEDFEKLKVIKTYFSKYFSVLSEEMREKLLKLKITKEDLKCILKRIAFLPEDKQKMFIEELSMDNEENDI
ncbi:MAG: hypothetical protein KGD63_00580 [Candidatus Lokiarchaeota archaeon]|nr:hypothetical protein [Candidatus Lokiarchaeota archaeon]